MSSDIEKYGEEKENTGKILGAIGFARDNNMTETQIREYLEKTYKLSKEDIAKYLSPAYA